MTAEENKPISLEEARLASLKAEATGLGTYVLTCPASDGPEKGVNLNLKIRLSEGTLEWARFLENGSNRTLALTKGKGWKVSTVFLGLDHGFGISKAPVLWESMVFGGPLDGQMRRYDDWERAHTGHLWFVKECENIGKWRMFCFNVKKMCGAVLRWSRSLKNLKNLVRR